LPLPTKLERMIGASRACLKDSLRVKFKKLYPNIASYFGNNISMDE
jgi:hypothetical protein